LLVLGVVAALRCQPEVEVAVEAGILENVEFSLPVELRTPAPAVPVRTAQ
jgi:hypothetical protein